METTTTDKAPIYLRPTAELAELVKSAGQPAFRTKQIYEWLYAKGVPSYDEMSNLPKTLRAFLEDEAPLIPLKMVERRISSDGTRKYLFELFDGSLVESVGIPSTKGDRLTVCFSTQVGCAMSCAFCATGLQGFTRNLGPGEMAAQALAIQKDMETRVSNAVAMGQGEPFLNYDASMDALRILNNDRAVGIGARRITVSTCGITPFIRRFATEPEQFTLAISLHSARQEIRDQIMPRVSNYPLPALKSALCDYIDATNRRVTLEYLMLHGVNDTPADRDALEDFCDGLLCHINLLPMNAVPDSPFSPSPDALVQSWLDYFNAGRVEASLRTSRGSDIDGACGQLRNAVAGHQSRTTRSIPSLRTSPSPS